jgi:hypothetical protein
MAENPRVDEGAYVENVAPLTGFRREQRAAIGKRGKVCEEPTSSGWSGLLAVAFCALSPVAISF